MAYEPQSRVRKVTGVSINAAGTDVATFTGLPAKYRVLRFMVYDTSTSLAISVATVGLFTAAAGGGTAVVAAAVITSLTASTKFADMTLAVAADYLTAATLYVRNVLAHGAAATISCAIEIIDLS